MIYLLIIFILALALAPLLHVVPSKYQRRIAHLREFAALQGLFVEFRSLPPGVLTGAESAALQPGKTIYYGLRIPAKSAIDRAQSAWVCGEQGWRSLPRGGAVPAALQGLPPSVSVASRDAGSCGIYWQEAGEEVHITQIYQALSHLICVK